MLLATESAGLKKKEYKDGLGLFKAKLALGHVYWVFEFLL